MADAGAFVALVARDRSAQAVELRFAAHAFDVHAPHLVDAEVTQALRRRSFHREDDASAIESAFANFRSLPFARHGHERLLGRAWALRRNVSAYDAMYVALAEALDADLLTLDRRLARAARTHTALTVLTPESS